MNKYKFFITVLCLLLFISSNAQMDWLDFENNGESEQLPELTMLNDSTFRVDFYGTNRFKKNISDTLYDVLRLSGKNGRTVDVGLPELPTKAFYIEMAIDTPNITIVSEEYTIIDSIYVIPAQEYSEPPEDTLYTSFEKNDSLYSSSGFYPSFNIQISMPFIIRGHKISSLVFFPIQFNPVTNQLKVFKHIEVVVHGAQSIENDKDNSFYDSFLNGLVINYNPKNNTDGMIDLMIITPNEYENTLLPFKEWKEKMGIRTKIVTRENLETNDPPYLWIADPNEENWEYDGIDGFIKNYYDTEGCLAPEFLLFIGETDPNTPEMPTHYWTYSGDMRNDTIATDYYYTTMDLDGTNTVGILDFPDMFSGRISVDDVEELSVVINKIINYEKNPYLENTDWYNKINLTAEFDWYTGQNGGWSNKCYCIEGYYYTYTSLMLKNYLTANTTYNISDVFFNDFLIEYPGETMCWEWEEIIYPEFPFITDEALATDAVISDINNGCFLINHRDHGSSRNNINGYGLDSEGWRHPPLDSIHIDDLNNGDMLPVMFSINCQTGWFDGATETQHPYFQTGNFDCLGEFLLSKEEGGVVGFIGATRSTRGGYNDEFCYGMFDAIFDDFDTYNNSIQTPNYRLGPIKDYGLLYMLNKYFYGNASTNYNYLLFEKLPKYNRRQFEEFHVLGDPTLEMWTGVPQPLYAYVDFDDNSVTVYNENDQVIPEAKVVFQYGPEIDEEYEVKMTDINGKVYSNLLNNYDVEVSALKHNYIPWYTTIISETQQWPADEDIRGNIIVTNNSELTFPTADIEIPQYARIVVTEGGHT